MRIRPANFPADHTALRVLLADYTRWVRAGLVEVGLITDPYAPIESLDDAALPGPYVPPRGCILVADDDAALVGCIMMKPLSDTVCEMKRLYVADAGRGGGLGERLVRELIDVARERGYLEMRLSTHVFMTPAIALYRSLGFRDCPAYHEDPLQGTLWQSLKLTHR